MAVLCKSNNCWTGTCALLRFCNRKVAQASSKADVRFNRIHFATGCRWPPDETMSRSNFKHTQSRLSLFWYSDALARSPHCQCSVPCSQTKCCVLNLAYLCLRWLQNSAKNYMEKCNSHTSSLRRQIRLARSVICAMKAADAGVLPEPMMLKEWLQPYLVQYLSCHVEPD